MGLVLWKTGYVAPWLGTLRLDVYYLLTWCSRLNSQQSARHRTTSYYSVAIHQITEVHCAPRLCRRRLFQHERPQTRLPTCTFDRACMHINAPNILYQTVLKVLNYFTVSLIVQITPRSHQDLSSRLELLMLDIGLLILLMGCQGSSSSLDIGISLLLSGQAKQDILNGVSIVLINSRIDNHSPWTRARPPLSLVGRTR